MFIKERWRTHEPRLEYLAYHEGPGLVDPAGPLRSNLAISLQSRPIEFTALAPQDPKGGNRTERAPRMPPWRRGRALDLREQRREQRASRAREEKTIQQEPCFERCLPTSPSPHLAQPMAGLGGGCIFHSQIPSPGFGCVSLAQSWYSRKDGELLNQDGSILPIMKGLGLGIRRGHCVATWR